MVSSIANKENVLTRHISDSDTDNKPYLNNDNWPRYLVLTSAGEELPLSKLSPFTEGVSSDCWNPEKHQEIEGWLISCGGNKPFENTPGDKKVQHHQER